MAGPSALTAKERAVALLYAIESHIGGPPPMWTIINKVAEASTGSQDVWAVYPEKYLLLRSLQNLIVMKLVIRHRRTNSLYLTTAGIAMLSDLDGVRRTYLGATPSDVQSTKPAPKPPQSGWGSGFMI